MADNILTIKELELIQERIKEFIIYVEKYDKVLPQCFDYCKLIVRNIEVCKNADYIDIDCLSEYIKQDWKTAMLPHCGLSDYYILNNDFETQKSINSKISEFIDIIDKFILRQ